MYLFLIFFFFLAPIQNFAPIIKIIPVQETKNYSTLSGNNEHDRDNVKKLITMLGKHSKISILLHHQKALKNLGADINHVHPIIFMEIATCYTEMRHYVRKIKDDTFKWNPFIKGLTGSILHEIQKNNFYQYIEDLAKIRGIPAPLIKNYINFDHPKKSRWDHLVKFLVEE